MFSMEHGNVNKAVEEGVRGDAKGWGEGLGSDLFSIISDKNKNHVNNKLILK